MIQSYEQTPQLAVYGAGDHGLVVAETAQAAGYTITGFVDDTVEVGTLVGWWRVLSSDAAVLSEVLSIVGVGDNATRRAMSDRLYSHHRELASAIHPTAWVSLSTTVGDGVFIGPQAVIHAEATVETGAIINSGAVVEHHNQIGAFSHIAPGAVLGGRCEIGENALVGLGARVLPNCSVGADAIVAAGAVVDRDVPPSQRVMGVPARPK
jgi:sugar O-acyltransferase (sialic acid O-acetyltransferase NeuD family)